jgi:universal stress protein E
LVHVSPLSDTALVWDVVGASAVGQQLQSDLQHAHWDAFRTLADSEKVPEDRRHFLNGPVAATLSRFAQEREMDVVVVATINRSRLDRWLIGSSCEHIVESAPCSVLAVPPLQDRG